MTMLIASLMFSSAFLFANMNHPLAMGLILLIQTMLTCLMVGSISKTFWFSYILFLIFLGGMLVLFIYVTALASNEMFSLSMKTTLIHISVIVSLTVYSIMSDSFMTHPINETVDSSVMGLTIPIQQENYIDLIKLYNYPTNYITIMLMSYLLITLIAIVKVTNMFYGPLRKMN